MLLDNNAILAGSISAAGVITGQAFTATGLTVGGNALDIASLALGGNQAGDTGAGESLEVSFSILTAPTGAVTNVTFQLIQADDAALTSNVQVINQTDAFPIASLPAGTLIPLHWDRTAPYAPKRYVGVRVLNAGVATGAVYFAAVAKNVQDVKNIYFKSGFTVV